MTTTEHPSIALTEHSCSVYLFSSIEDFDVETAARDLAGVRAVIDALRSWEGVLTELLDSALGRNSIEVEGVGRVEVKHGTDRKEWDRRALLRAVLDSRCPPDRETGEADPSDDGRAEVGGELVTCSPDLSRVLHVWNLGAPRVTALRERGIDPDEFAATSPGRTSVVIS